MDNIKDTLTNVTKNVFKTSRGFLKSTKLTLDLSNEESKLKGIYVEIGKKVHEIYSYGGSLGKFFDEKYEEIAESERKIDVLRKDLDEAKGTKACPKCGKTADSMSEFCSKCGGNFVEASPVISLTDGEWHDHRANEAPTPPPIQHVSGPQAQKNCQVCGKENANENKFCFSCGRML